MTGRIVVMRNTSDRVVNGPHQQGETWDLLVNGPREKDETWSRLVNGPSEEFVEESDRAA
ncbi:MAG TPA: hypothetical protein VKV05_06875 [Terriglobales bacterium]|nr:hypothetical protein [Terriglobales bacterium]